MSRRLSRGRRSGSARGGIEQMFSALFYGGATRIDTDLVTSSGGNVNAFVDYADASHTFPVDAGTLPVPTADATLNNALSATFSAHRIKSSRAASAWRYMHDGTGCEAYIVLVPTDVTGARTLFASNPNTAVPGDTGAEVFTNGTSAVLGIANNGAYPIAFNIGGAVAAGTPIVLGYQSATARTLDVAFYRGTTQIANSDYLSAVAAGDPTSSLCIGAGTAGANFAAMRLGAFYSFPRILSTVDRATLFTRIQSKYGIAP
jgi:hypothetical protein